MRNGKTGGDGLATRMCFDFGRVYSAIGYLHRIILPKVISVVWVDLVK
jgi:hypothetical protein